jgi:capsular exopolysaccharide synthesis family protein
MNILNIRIELHSILRDLIKNVWAIFMAGLIAIMGIYVVTKGVYTPEYTAKSMLVVNAKHATSATISLFNLSVEMTDVISRVLIEPSVQEKAAEILGVEDFDGKLNSSVYADTNFIELTVTSDSPQKSYELLKAVVEAYPLVSDSVFDNVVITVLTMPEIPHAPSNRITTGNRVLIAMACSVFIAGLVVVFSIFRDTVKDEEDFKNKLEAKLIGTVPHEKKQFTIQERLQNKNKALLIHNNAFISLSFVENYHKIAAKIEHINHRKGSKVFAVTSVTENEGKSTTAANIAISLADRGHKVILIDLDGKKPALYKVFDKKHSEKSEFGNLLNRKIQPKEFRLKRYKQSPLYLAINTEPHPEYGEWIESGELKKVIRSFEAQADFIILDAAPIAVDSVVTDIVKIVDQTIMVVRTDTAFASDINDAIATIKEVGGNVVGCILNDTFPDFNLLSIAGTYETGFRYGGRYAKYSNKYGKYGKYGKYSRYENPQESEE